MEWKDVSKEVVLLLRGKITDEDKEKLIRRALYRLTDETFNTAEAKAEATNEGIEDLAERVLRRLRREGRQKKTLKIRLTDLTEEQRRALEELGLL